MALLNTSQASRSAHTDNDPGIQIKLNQQSPDSSYAYTTDDIINGTASIKVGHDVDFDDLDIAFEGLCYIIVFVAYLFTRFRHVEDFHTVAIFSE